MLAAATVAARVDAGLRLAAFAVRANAQYTTTLGTEGDSPVISEWAEVVERETNAAFERVRALPEIPDVMESVISHGRNWAEALEGVEWDRGDVLTVGSSKAGPLARGVPRQSGGEDRAVLTGSGGSGAAIGVDPNSRSGRSGIEIRADERSACRP